ncbi:MAG: MobA/MobL family protein, partial [Proteobacteria bacterium]|nr:MobA/MobL family protein [Pseudomonadota bacterium]
LTHFAHRPIGKTTHKKGFTYQHVNYITRDDACSKTLADNMPADRDGARPFFEQMASMDGVPLNARIADTLIIALPIEMTREQRHEAVASFMEKIGKGRIAWIAAFHDIGKDEHNPHCHIIFRDADIETGRKVIGTTTSAKDVREAEEKGWKVPPRMTTKDLRNAWCDHINAEMERHGYEARFDSRTLKDQGIDREPQIHIGPSANDMTKRRHDFESHGRGDQTNPYTLLDAGSRAEHNQRIIERNKKAEADCKHIDDAWKRKLESVQPKNEAQREKLELRKRQDGERHAIYAEQKKDRIVLREAHHAQKLEHAQWARALYADARKQAFVIVKAANDQRWKQLRTIKDNEARQTAAAELKEQQKADYGKAAAAEVDMVRPAKNEAWQKLQAEQANERKQLGERHEQELSAVKRQHIAERHALDEHWLQKNMTHAANKMGAQLEASQSMPVVQATAVRLVKMRAKAARERDRFAKDIHPAAAAAAHFADRARTESANRTSIRQVLDALRQNNQFRAAEHAERRTRPGVMHERRTALRAAILAKRVARQSAEQQQSIGAAVQSGRSLSSADRANATPREKGEVTSREAARQARRERQFDLFVQRDNSGKGRNGGRSGR